MKIFLSWSGDLSRELAESLRDWLPAVIQSVKPFFTPNDIEKGARWNKDISAELESSAFGIFCLTKENLSRPWIMFEAGALSKAVEASRVCPVLFGVDSADLEGPLVQFQAAPFSETEIRRLIKTINAGLGEARLEDSVLNSVFEMWWPKLNQEIMAILSAHSEKNGAQSSQRTDREILEEVLQLTRLSASEAPRSSAKPHRQEPSAYIHCLKHIEKLVDLKDEGSQIASLAREIFLPIEYIIGEMSFSPRYHKEMKEIMDRINSKLFSE